MQDAVIWTWTPDHGVTVHDHHRAGEEAIARQVAAPLFGPNTLQTDLGYFYVGAGQGAHLFWLLDDYQSLYEYSQTDPGRDIRDLPSPPAASATAM